MSAKFFMYSPFPMYVLNVIVAIYGVVSHRLDLALPLVPLGQGIAIGIRGGWKRGSTFDRTSTGAGVGWHEHDAGVYEGCERFFRPGYAMNLVSQWIPALEGVKARLEAGGWTLASDAQPLGVTRNFEQAVRA